MSEIYRKFTHYFNTTYEFRKGNGKYTNNDWELKAYSPTKMKPHNKGYDAQQYGNGDRKMRLKTKIALYKQRLEKMEMIDNE